MTKRYIDVVRGHGKFKRWHWNLMSVNGQVVSTSESYYSKWGAIRAAKAMASNYFVPLDVRVMK